MGAKFMKLLKNAHPVSHVKNALQTAAEKIGDFHITKSNNDCKKHEISLIAGTAAGLNIPKQILNTGTNPYINNPSQEEIVKAAVKIISDDKEMSSTDKLAALHRISNNVNNQQSHAEEYDFKKIKYAIVGGIVLILSITQGDKIISILPSNFKSH